MLRSCALVVSLLALAACDGGGGVFGGGSDMKCGLKTPATQIMNPNVWRIGPVINGKNYSVNMPPTPSPHPEGWAFDVPYPDVNAGHVHYVTFHHGSLAGKTQIKMRYRIEAAEGVELHARTAPGQPGMITLYFQQRDDDWQAYKKTETARWFATFATKYPLTVGEGEIVAPLSGLWTALEKSTSQNNPAGFQNAIQNAECVGFVMGGGDGYGHGVYATGPAKFVLLDYRVE